MKLRIALASGPSAALIGLACTSAVVDPVAPGPDSSADASAASSHSPDDAGISDAVASDARLPLEAGPAKPLDVVCEGDPCYVSVSGNGGRHVCGLLDDGTVRCWGRDTMNPPTPVDGGPVPGDSALGRGVPVSTLEGATPAPVPGLSSVTQISVGPNLGTCARTSDGSVYCWGRNEFGQLGRPSSQTRLSSPVRVDGLPPVDEVRLGSRTGCAIASSDRALHCWGEKMDGLGVDAGSTTTFAPQVVAAFRPPVKSLAVGTWTIRDTIMALLDDDVLASIGEAPSGEWSTTAVPTHLRELAGVLQLGTFGYLDDRGVLMRWRPSISTLYVPNNAIVEMKISGTNQVQQGGVLLATGRLFRWGPNTAGALGFAPDALVTVQHPLETPHLDSQVVSFATTFESTCASFVDGKVKCWGGNAYGELGRGSVDLDPHPDAEVIR